MKLRDDREDEGADVGETVGYTLNLAYFSPSLNLSGTKIGYMYRVVRSPRGGKYLDIHMYRR